jgi:hypothetical protein
VPYPCHSRPGTWTDSPSRDRASAFSDDAPRTGSAAPHGHYRQTVMAP